MSALDVAILALKDMGETVSAMTEEGKERFLMGLEFTRRKVSALREELEKNINSKEKMETVRYATIGTSLDLI